MLAGVSLPPFWYRWQYCRYIISGKLEIDGLKVICVTANGDSSNRKFFKMHNHLELGLPVPYKAKNVYATDRHWLYFT